MLGKKEKKPMFRIKLIGIALIGAISCSMVAATPDAKKITLAEYVNTVEKPASADSPKFDTTLWIHPIIDECHPSGRFSPNEAFSGKFPDELRNGMAAFFQRKGRFAKVDLNSGDLSLVAKWVEFEGGSGNPPRLSVGIEIRLYYTPTEMTLLNGKVESSMPVNSGALHELRVVTVGEREWILKNGTYGTAEVCRSMFNRLDSMLMENSKAVLEKIAK